MRKIVEKLIEEYYEPGLITTVLIPMKSPGAQGAMMYKEARMRTAKAWDVKDPEEGEFSDDMVIDMIEKIRAEKAEQIFKITISIIKSQGKQEEEVVDGEKYLSKAEESQLKSMLHPEKMSWCLLRLNKLGVISFFIEQFWQPVLDKEGDLLGMKIVPKEVIVGGKAEDGSDSEIAY